MGHLPVNLVTPAQRYGHTRQFLTGGFFLLALVVIMAVFFAGRERANHQAAEATLKATAQLTNVLSNVRQTETGLRGYVLTNNPISQTTYNLAVAAMPHTLADLDAALVQGREADALPQIHALVTEKMAELARAMLIYKSGSTAGAVAQINTDLNLQTMVQLRVLVMALQAKEALFLQANEVEDARNGMILQIATALAVGGTLLLGWFAIRDSAGRTTELLAAEAALLRANEALEAKVAERTRTLQASEAQFRILAESLPGFVFMDDPSGASHYVNPQFNAFTGLTAEQLQNDGWVQALHPDDAPACVEKWSQCVAKAQMFEMEYRWRRHDGVYRWFIARSAPIFRADGSLVGWVGNATDIDDRKKAEVEMIDANIGLEEEIAGRTRELERIFNLSIDILTVTKNGQFLALSPAWEKILGFKVAETLGKNIADFIHPEDLSRTYAVLSNVTNGQVVTGFENRFRRADGSYRWLSWRAVSVPEEGRGYSVARDVTSEKEREEQLRQSQKMEVVGQLTGGIAHDFNNLLTIIMGSLELLQRGLTIAEPKIIRRIEAAMDGAKRAAALTHRLLAFARRQPLEPTNVEPNRLVASMADMLTRVLGENIALEFVHGAGLWRVQADVNQLENSILNLAVNARDAMPAGGHLTIETQNVYLDDVYAASRADVDPGQYVMIAVTDTGSGMNADVVAKVFEPFFTTKPQGQGTGLGLAQVYGFIKQSQGHVAIYSEPGQGTSVKLYLPRLVSAQDQPRVEMPVVASSATGRGEFILVVEDEENVRNFSTEVLEELGYQVIAAENASAALAVLETMPRVDMLFTDVVLTGTINGRVLADEVVRRRPATAVLFTTGYTRNAIVHHGRLDDGIDFIGKPFSANALGQLVAKILERNRVKYNKGLL